MNSWKNVTDKMNDLTVIKAYQKGNLLVKMKKFTIMGTSYEVRKDEYFPNQWGGIFGKCISHQSGKKQAMEKVMKNTWDYK